jgi:endonuclease G
LSVLETSPSPDLAAAQTEAAASRAAERSEQRQANIETLEEPGGIGRADDPGRVAARLDRLGRHWARAPLPNRREETLGAPPEEVAAAALALGGPWGGAPSSAPMEAAGEVLERIVGTPDFIGINYLESGVTAAHAVGRVNIGDGKGKVAGYGTGSLVAPHVLLTNNHVLPDAETARASVVELDFEDGPDGQARQSHRFPLAPDALFITDKGLDFALVAVDPGAAALAGYGFNPLIEAEGKAIIGDFVTIVQHPRGERKQIALRENRIVDVVESMLHYEADTEPGSSGSPVFNDQWEVVALHHASVPASGPATPEGFINEGIRISRIIGYLREQAGAEPGPLLGPVLAPGSDRPVAIAPAPGVEATAVVGLEAVEIDPDYSNREGYQSGFLGSGKRDVPPPALSAALAAKAAVRTDVGGSEHVLPYHHFSLAINKERKLAFFTAVNIDGTLERRVKRDPDKWAFDPRLSPDDQTGEAVYVDNDLDRGHLVRRLDPAWGETDAAAKVANDDTFHFTNCAPQHGDFNRNATMWAGLEDYVLDHADNENFKVTVFSGPVFGDADPLYRGVTLPLQFWKVVVMAKSPGLLSATAYLLSQESLLDELEVAAVEEFEFGAYRTFQVRVAEVERLTELSFGALAGYDPLGSQESAGPAARPIVHETAVIL